MEKANKAKPGRTAGASLWKRIRKNKWTYILFLPALIYLVIFCYAPFYGIQIAFKDYKFFAGIEASDWVGLKWFKMVLTDPKFFQLLRNTIKISLLRILFTMPVPIIFAILLTEVKGKRFKKAVQTITSFPNFLSWVVFAGIIYNFTGPYGVINRVLQNKGMDTINLTTNADAFLPLIIITCILKEFGYGAIIYLAAIAGVDEQLYEAAAIDGAGRMKQIWHVLLPGIRPIICFQYCVAAANVLSAGFDQIFMFLNPPLYEVGDIIDTYVYRLGLLNTKYELSTAVGLMKGVVSCVLLVVANKVSKKIGERAIW